jgi:lipopolysaccharide export system protein LptA
MPIHIPRLRRWFAVGAIGLSMVVVGMYLYARWGVHNALKDVPNKLGIEVQQSTENFSISKSEQGRTLFTVRASKAVQYKQGGRAELHDVNIILYGRDSSRFDQISGADFAYDPQTGNVYAKGEVKIDLEANPQGLSNPDQTAPKELKNPIHLKTSGLVFNQKTGDAYTKERVEFSVPQATGSAVGVNYVAKTSVLMLDSQVEMLLSGPGLARITAAHGVISKDPRQVVLDHPRMNRVEQKLEAEKATLFLRPDNTVARVVAQGGVQAEVHGRSEMHARADQAEVILNSKQDSLRTAVFSGGVKVDSGGPQPMSGNAGRMLLDFSGKNRLEKIHAEEGVKLVQHRTPPTSNAIASNSTTAPNAHEIEITAPAMNFFVANGSHLDRAQTSGAAEIVILQPGSSQRTLITAGKFEAQFGTKSNGGTRLVSLHGAPDARIVTATAGQRDRTSISSVLDAAFRPEGGIDFIVQRGNVTYVDADRKAWADSARYTPTDQMLLLTGSPRVSQTGMTTTALTMRFNRATGDAFAEGDVKSTYSELKEQPGGALLASSDPIHITSRSMQAHSTPATALYTGNARLWQDANVVEAPSIEFDKDRRTVTAQGNAAQPVSTVLAKADSPAGSESQQNTGERKSKARRTAPVTITSTRLTYIDNDRRVHFESNVVAKGADVTISANQIDAFLLSRHPNAGNQASNRQSSTGGAPAGAAQLDRIVASGNVVVQQPSRRATGQKLVYTGEEEKYVLTGGPPSIFDAEHGKITGDSLTFFSRDDRVLVEGGNASPTVTQTRVAR